MRLIRTTIALGVTALVASASAQTAAPSRADIRLLSGVAGYSNETVAAIALVAGHPELPGIIAERMSRGDDPLATLPAGLSDSQRAAVARVLVDAPEAIEVLAADGAAAAQLSRQYVESPTEFSNRLSKIRTAQDDLEDAAARGWQFLLENDPVAMGDYRDMLTRYVLEQRKSEPRYAAVRVTDRRYYYAAPPSDDFRRFAEASGAPQSLRRTMDRWNELYGPAATVERIQRTISDAAPIASPTAKMVVDLPPSERATFWRADETFGGVDAGLGLMPIIMQPPADMPADAQSVLHAERMATMWLGRDANGAADQQPRDQYAAARDARQMRIGFHEDAEFSQPPVEIPLSEIDATNRALTQAPDDAVETIVTYEPGDYGAGFANDFGAVTNTLLLGYGNAYDPYRGVYRDNGCYAPLTWRRCDVFNPCYPECLVSPPVQINLGRPGATSSYYYGTRGGSGWRDCDDNDRHDRRGVTFYRGNSSRFGNDRDGRNGNFDRTPIRITRPDQRRNEIRINSAPSKLDRPQTLNPRGQQRADRGGQRFSPIDLIRGQNNTNRVDRPRSATTNNRPAKSSTVRPLQPNRKKN